MTKLYRLLESTRFLSTRVTLDRQFILGTRMWGKKKKKNQRRRSVEASDNLLKSIHVSTKTTVNRLLFYELGSPRSRRGALPKPFYVYETRTFYPL